MTERESNLSDYGLRAKYYRIEYDETRDIGFYLDMITKDETHVLEVPCGAGRLTRKLAKKARHVVAVDIEPDMVASLKQLIRKERLESRITALVGDMTDLNLGARFDLVIVPSEALQLLPKHTACKAVHSMSEQLRPGGRLVIDCATYSKNVVGMPEYFLPQAYGDAWVKQWKREVPEEGNLTRYVRFRIEADAHFFEFKYELGLDGSAPKEFFAGMRLFSYDKTWFIKNKPESISRVEFLTSYQNVCPFGGQARLIAILQKRAGDCT